MDVARRRRRAGEGLVSAGVGGGGVMDDDWVRGRLIPRVPMTIPAVWPGLRPLPLLDVGTGVLDETVEYRSWSQS